jgi:hypothetical protein
MGLHSWRDMPMVAGKTENHCKKTFSSEGIMKESRNTATLIIKRRLTIGVMRGKTIRIRGP